MCVERAGASSSVMCGVCVCVAFAVKVSEVGGWRYLSGWRLALKDESGPNAAPNELRAFWMQNRGR